MKRSLFSIMLMCSCVIIAGSNITNDPPKKKMEPVARWTGTITYDETDIFTNPAFTGKGERHMSASFVNAMPTLFREDDDPDLNFTDNKGAGSHSFKSNGKLGVPPATIDGCTDCQGSGQAELHSVVVREWDNTYDIEVIPPACSGTNCDGTIYGPETRSITIGSYPLTNRDILDGSITTTGEMVGGFGTYTTTIIWHFERVKEDDVELIVTPQNYDTWLPEPGKNELNKGNVLTINLKLQGKNGKPLKVKANSFELHLNHTSIEPGITINYPLEPDKDQLPDLRFIQRIDIESVESDQDIKVTSLDGKTGKAFIASYDGGGYTFLTAYAVLNDSSRVVGNLIKSGGISEIPIPKSDGSMIGEAWLKKYNNPGDYEDDEISKGNKNNGDGLTAYEEYRGVMTQGTFQRLDPQKKELGIKITWEDLIVLGEGITWFKSASDIETILFDVGEIGDDRRFNNNYRSGHVFDQHVIWLETGNLRLQSNSGHSYGIYDLFDDIPPGSPTNTKKIIIDVYGAKTNYKDWNAIQPLPFTELEKIANVVAHEIGHSVGMWHHGDLPEEPSPQIATATNNYRVFGENSFEYTRRPQAIEGAIGLPGGLQSGDLSCIMVHNPYYSWSHRVGPDGLDYFFEVPAIQIGKIFCNSSKGTGINSEKFMINQLMNSNSTPTMMYEFNKFFGDASNGNCLSLIKLK